MTVLEYIARDYRGENRTVRVTGKILIAAALENLYLAEVNPGRFRVYYVLQESPVFYDLSVAMADFSACYLHSRGIDDE
ncbi:MAG: hypothetical protein ACK5S6_03480 [bacterium]|jgi:hypothetical protein